MNPRSKSLKLIALLLYLMMMLQGCNVYNIPISLNEAVSKEKSVKIANKSGEKTYYERIYFENNQLYGNVGGLLAKGKIIDTNDIIDIYQFNYKKNAILNGLGGGLLTLFLAIVTIAFISYY